MNSSKRGAVYGFKLQSLDLVRGPLPWGCAGGVWGCGGGLILHPVTPRVAPQLLDTKSTDRKMTLLHFIALTVREKYPELATFWQELHFVEKAAAGAPPRNFVDPPPNHLLKATPRGPP